MPSISDTATLTRVPGALRTAAMALAAGVDSGMDSSSCGSRGGCRNRHRRRRGRRCGRMIAQRERAFGRDGTIRFHDRPLVLPVTHARALVAAHAAVVLFGFAGLFGRWLDLSPVA